MRKNSCSYPVEFVDEAFGDSSVLADMLAAAAGSSSPRVLIVADANLVRHAEGLGAAIGRYVQKHGIVLAGRPVVIPGGERAKMRDAAPVRQVFDAMLSSGIGADDVVLALGGGTVLDIAGYAAAQVRGGVKVIRVPTTPSAILGGAFARTAYLNAPTEKNAFALPSVPAGVVIDVGLTQSVLDGVWRAGLSEPVRFATAHDVALLKKLQPIAGGWMKRDVSVLRELATTLWALRQKKGDSTLGDWAAARLEAQSDYKLPYGYAVVIGVCIELARAVAIGVCGAHENSLVRDTLSICGALEGALHSRYLVARTDELLAGLEIWRRQGHADVEQLAALGKCVCAENVDRSEYAAIMDSVF